MTTFDEAKEREHCAAAAKRWSLRHSSESAAAGQTLEEFYAAKLFEERIAAFEAGQCAGYAEGRREQTQIQVRAEAELQTKLSKLVAAADRACQHMRATDCSFDEVYALQCVLEAVR